MGGGQSQESSTATVTRNSPDQRNLQIGGRDVSSRKSGGLPPSSSQFDSSRRRYLVVNDGRRGEGGGRGGESDESPSSRHHSLSQPSPHTHNHHPSSHSNSHAHGHNHQRPHPPHRQRHHRPPPPPENLHPLNMELSMPLFSSSRTQPMPNEPTSESLHPELELVLPRPSTRHRRYYEAGHSGDLDLDLSMASLSRRLRAVGLLTEDDGNGAGGGSGNGGSGSSSSRRHHRPRRHHSHSSHAGRSRHHLSTSAPPSSVVLVRGLSASEYCSFICTLFLLSLPLSLSFSLPSLPPLLINVQRYLNMLISITITLSAYVIHMSLPHVSQRPCLMSQCNRLLKHSSNVCLTTNHRILSLAKC